MRTLPLFLLAACTSLPAGWEDAGPVSDLVQSDCGESPYDTGFQEAADAFLSDGDLMVVYEPVHFRCAQDVEGFWKQEGGQVDVLLQPKDMNPSVVAGCDCGYRVEVTVPADEPMQVTAWRRWDDLNDDNEPVEVPGVDLTR